MWKWVHFITRNTPFFTWLFLAVISVMLLCEHNPYQRSIWFCSANEVVGAAYSVTNNITGYFGLRQINEDLLARAGALESENLQLRLLIEQYELEHQDMNPDSLLQYTYRTAHVVNNSIVQAQNYITLNKGSKDGLKADMGVADQNGIVGIVSAVSDHYALVISVLNPNLRLSAKIKNSEYFGSLVWNGESSEYVLLEDLPRNVEFENGDTVVTTGYSTSFPENVPIGVVEESYSQHDNNFLTLRIHLFTDFGRLNDVHVICNMKQEEQQCLESQIQNNKTN